MGNEKKQKKFKSWLVISMLVVVALLVVIGGLIIYIINVGWLNKDNQTAELINSITNAENKDESIQVFIESNATDARMTEIGQKIQELDGVNTVKFISKEDAMNHLKDSFKGNEDLLVGLQDVLPSSYIVTYTDKLKGYKIIEEIRSWEDVIKIQNANTNPLQQDIYKNLLTGDFSGVAGEYVNAKGETMTLLSTGLLKEEDGDIHASMPVRQDDGTYYWNVYFYDADGNFDGSFARVIYPIGVSITYDIVRR